MKMYMGTLRPQLLQQFYDNLFIYLNFTCVFVMVWRYIYAYDLGIILR